MVNGAFFTLAGETSVAKQKVRISSISVRDIRVPTSDSSSGSDAFHKNPDPDYSAAYLEISTNIPNLNGVGFVFTIGNGNDLVCRAIEAYAQPLVGCSLGVFTSNPGAFWKKLNDHPQLRWLRDGINRMAFGALINALWDLVSKYHNKPLWQLLAEMPSEELVNLVDFRYLRDALTPEDAFALLERRFQGLDHHVASVIAAGPPAYCTAGWSGLELDDVERRTRHAHDELKLPAIKAKVGLDIEADRARMERIRSVIGENGKLGVDANQWWGAPDAIAHMEALADLNPWFIEEPTHPDDVFAYQDIARALRPRGILIAGGEHASGAVSFKNLLRADALDLVQIDVARVGGVNELLAEILLAAKFDKPVCPHAGGIGLCNGVQQLTIFDQIRVGGQRDDQICEWIDFLHDGDTMLTPVEIKDGRYCVPQVPGFSWEMTPSFLDAHEFPNGDVWRDRQEHFALRYA